MKNYTNAREFDYMATAYASAGILVENNEVIYDGDGYFITRDSDGRIYFEDNNEVCELSHEIKNPGYIKYDEYRGWIYKNGRELPWT